jgi:hypothetical protein
MPLAARWEPLIQRFKLLSYLPFGDDYPTDAPYDPYAFTILRLKMN